MSGLVMVRDEHYDIKIGQARIGGASTGPSLERTTFISGVVASS